MLTLTLQPRHIAVILVFLACCSALAGDYPPLPEVERTRLTDDELFGKLDTADPAMKAVLETLKSDGVHAAKSALADHFRERTTPRWWIDPHARPKHDSRPAGAKTSKADLAVRHVYRGFDFGPDIDWLDNPSYAPGREFDKEWSMAFLRMPWWDDHLYESIFMLNAPNAVAEEDRIVTERDGANLLMVAAEAEGQVVEVVQGQMEPVRRGWKRGGETVQPNPTAVFAQRKSGPATFALLLYPVAKGEPIPKATIEFVPVAEGADPIAVRVGLADGRQRVLVDQLGEGEVAVEGIGKVATPGVK